MAEWHDATEEYLEAILEIEEEGIVPIRARLVERLGLSAPAVSETVNRLVDHGYAELLDDRTPPPHRRRAARSPLDRAPPPARRAAARRRDRARVGEGPQGGRPLGARDLGRRRGEARAAPRRPRDVPARQPDPRVRATRSRAGASTPLSQSAARARSSSGASARRSRSTTTPSCSSPGRSSSPARTRSSSSSGPDGVQRRRATPASRLVPRSVAQLIYVVPA